MAGGGEKVVIVQMVLKVMSGGWNLEVRGVYFSMFKHYKYDGPKISLNVNLTCRVEQEESEQGEDEVVQLVVGLGGGWRLQERMLERRAI